MLVAIDITFRFVVNRRQPELKQFYVGKRRELVIVLLCFVEKQVNVVRDGKEMREISVYRMRNNFRFFAQSF